MTGGDDSPGSRVPGSSVTGRVAEFQVPASQVPEFPVPASLASQGVNGACCPHTFQRSPHLPCRFPSSCYRSRSPARVLTHRPRRAEVRRRRSPTSSSPVSSPRCHRAPLLLLSSSWCCSSPAARPILAHKAVAVLILCSPSPSRLLPPKSKMLCSGPFPRNLKWLFLSIFVYIQLNIVAP